MHRTKKEHDENEGKWIGIGGHCEEGESPEECAIREIREETGIEVHTSALHYCGIVTFVCDGCEGKYMHLFRIVLKDDAALPPSALCNADDCECDEGELKWIAIKEMDALPQWEGDKIFLRLMRQGAPFFSLKLVYKGGRLASAALNGAPYPV